MKLTTQQKIFVLQYVLDSIDFDGLGYPESQSSSVKQLREALTSEMGTTKQRQGVSPTDYYYYVAKLADFLKGLPSYLAIAFSNYEIIELGNEWGIDLSSKTLQDAWLEQYWYELAHAIHTLSRL
jgi:hypothetical protein